MRSETVGNDQERVNVKATEHEYQTLAGEPSSLADGRSDQRLGRWRARGSASLQARRLPVPPDHSAVPFPMTVVFSCCLFSSSLHFPFCKMFPRLISSLFEPR